ncbi:uncharacterized protein BDCG_05661 [Blastomyces dermatitidis ER-3]|uniref:Uncharacterized protein n=1 Tax=Ajellomyces dermatitidis (strain ER-3 / ATCC MYA-2586) TaxID=559297 RepID=A0ABP2F1D5_AJEDR|nr:uncharacterized protein BDCG_05661 [Blastomyces dermatitidis ER-3]EEQ90541.1 hypothetical protein BDCG_05661 [Blastomyces dermatitidis ER-3]
MIIHQEISERVTTLKWTPSPQIEACSPVALAPQQDLTKRIRSYKENVSERPESSDTQTYENTITHPTIDTTMSNDNMEPSNSNMSIDAVPQWLRAMLELQQQQIADMHATQQHQYEEIQ